MTYRGEQEYPVKRIEPCKIPAFTQYEKCPTCRGTGWKREKGGYSMIVCPMCRGKKKLPVSTADGGWEKRKVI